jgi:hypothetical protein
LTFAEVRRGLQALSSLYVERRRKLPGGAVFDGAGKRAAFALYYGTLHFLALREIVRALPVEARAVRSVCDLGCGTAAAGAAWALEAGARYTGVDASGWAAGEARFTLASLGVAGRATRGDLAASMLPGSGAGILLAYTTNELDDAGREALRPRLADARRRGARVLIVEPLSRRAVPWWHAWCAAFPDGRADEWRFPARLPARVALLGRAAGLDPRELTARTLWLS